MVDYNAELEAANVEGQFSELVKEGEGGDSETITLLAKKNFFTAHKTYLKDPAFSDFTICASDGTEYKVHRNVISSHSKYFDKLCRGTFKESNTNSITLKDDPPLAVKFMVDFFYTFEYSTYEIDVNEPGMPPILLIDAWMWVIADKYDVPDLKAYALSSFESEAADMSSGSTSYTKDVFITVVPYIYSNTPPNDDSLRRATIRMWRHCGYSAVGCAVKGPEWKDLLGEYPAFASDMIEYLVSRDKGSG